MSSTPTFNFGASSSANTPGATSSTTQSGTTSNLFGTSGTPSSSIFGQSSTATSKPASTSLFGGGATAGGSPFGMANTGASQPTPLFGGNKGSNPVSGTTTPFGANSTGNAPTSGLFAQPAGTVSSAGSTGGLFGTTITNSAFGGSTGFSFGQKKDDGGSSTPAGSQNQPAGTQGGGLFNAGGKTTSGPGLFGSPATNNNSMSALAGSSTPAPSKTFNFMNNSTTPAGPPPADNGQAKSLFGGATNPQTAGGLFGGPKPTDSTQPKAGLIFPDKPSTGSSLFQPASTPASSGTGTASTTAPASEAPKPAFSFPSAVSAPGTQGSTAGGASATSTGGLFGGTKQTPASSAPPSALNMFAGIGGAATTTAPVTSTSTPAATATPSLFGGLGKTTTTSSSAAPSTTVPAATSNLFGGQPAASSSAQPSTTPATVGASEATTGTVNNQQQAGTQPFGASTTGPTAQLSRLKNKTMDEIITRWASDLLKYQKDFQDQAEKVAAWDRLLVENGAKIQTLFDSTCEATRATKEIENQLAVVEGQQAELTSWLDRYEADIDEMFARQVGHGESVQGPDQERERTYKLAEKLTDRLDEMGKNITSMIEAINDASANLSKNAKSDDPLSHIVRVLNSHLTQLQWIDQNAEILKAKVTASQKLGQSISSNGYGGLENDAADSFYRSYTGRR